VLDLAVLRASRSPDMGRPLPSGLVDGLPNRHASDLQQIEVALFKCAMLVRFFEAADDNVFHFVPPGSLTI